MGDHMNLDLSIILGAVIGAMIRGGQSPEDVRFQVEAAVGAAERFGFTRNEPGNA